MSGVGLCGVYWRGMCGGGRLGHVWCVSVEACVVSVGGGMCGQCGVCRWWNVWLGSVVVGGGMCVEVGRGKARASTAPGLGLPGILHTCG